MASVSLRKNESIAKDRLADRVEPTLEKLEGENLDLEDKLSEDTSLDQSNSIEKSAVENDSDRDLIDEPSKDLLEIPAFLRRQAN